MKLGDFPIGSLESRAAARVLLVQKRNKQERVQVVLSFRGPRRGEGTQRPDIPAAEPWTVCPDGKLFRVVYIPHVWIAREETPPTCSECRTPYRKAQEYPDHSLISYRADCVERHIPDFSSPAQILA